MPEFITSMLFWFAYVFFAVSFIVGMFATLFLIVLMIDVGYAFLRGGKQ